MKERLLRLVAEARPLDEAAFDALALELFRRQVAENRDYAAIAGGAEPRGWREIPAVPVSLFRDLDLTCFPPGEARHVFRTSGTTAGRRGVHRLRDTEVYDAGARAWAERCLGGPLPRAGVSLVSPAPDSSLGHMVRSFVPGATWCFDPEHGLDAEAARAALAAAREPVFVAATAFALDDLLAAMDGPVPLPEGSVLMVTGGFKGRRARLDGDALAARAAELLPGARIVGEYGMTELSSQLWAVPLGTPYRPPPWMRVLAVDPWTGAPAREGILRFVDLANHQTVLAIETEDLGEVLGDGSVVLRGRLAGAAPRGCSLTVEEARRGR